MVGVSVIIPVYNREKFIKEAIQSVLDQEFYGNIEIIVSDDGSTDRTLEIIQSFGSLVRVLRKPSGCVGQGVSGARNRGIKMATQAYICFLDSDDFYLPGHLNRIVRLLETNPDSDFSFCRMHQLAEINGTQEMTPWTMPVVTKRDVLYPVVLRSKIIHTNVIVVRREVFQIVGLFNEAYSNGEDGDMWMRVSEKYRGFFSDHYGAVYRVDHSSAQLTNNSHNQIIENSRVVFSEALLRNKERQNYDPYRVLLIKKILVGIDFSGKNKLCYLSSLVGLCVCHPVSFVRYLIDRVIVWLPQVATKWAQ